MKVRTKVKFRDLKEDELREVGDEFIVSKDRYKEILEVGDFVEEVKEDDDKE